VIDEEEQAGRWAHERLHHQGGDGNASHRRRRCPTKNSRDDSARSRKNDTVAVSEASSGCLELPPVLVDFRQFGAIPVTVRDPDRASYTRRAPGCHAQPPKNFTRRRPAVAPGRGRSR
jgi:hypothetical protein